MVVETAEASRVGSAWLKLTLSVVRTSAGEEAAPVVGRAVAPASPA
eukprot:COSAG02_NODE_1727_length_11182_cov_40.189209_7_plen_46_part_00